MDERVYNRNVDVEKAMENLRRRGYGVRYFTDRVQTAEWLVSELHGVTIGVGGSATFDELNVAERLAAENTLNWHMKLPAAEMPPVLRAAYESEVYISSANAIAETGEIVNIDGRGNRLAGMLYGHDRLIIIAGVNKLAPTVEDAIYRARNVAAPHNAQRLGRKTPCAVRADRCYDCQSPDRICSALSVLWNKPGGVGTAEVVLIGESLGY